MATGSGLIHSYSNTLPQKRVVTDRIILADPMSIAGLNALGLHNEGKFNFVNTPGRMYEWLEDTYVGRSHTCNDTDLTSDSAVTAITVTTAHPFQVGDVIEIDSEKIWISAISGNDLTVTRGWGDTDAATHASDATAYIRYNSRLEGASAGDSPFTEASTGYNYSLIMQKTIKVSRSDAIFRNYGIGSAVDYQIDKGMDELMMKLNRALYYGERLVGSSSAARGFGGLEALITTNDYAAGSAALTQKMLEDEMQDCFDAGGNPSLLLCNSWAKRKISDFYSGYVRTERSESMGGVKIEKILSPVGIELDIVVDRHCPTDTLYILDPNHVGFITIDDFAFSELGKTGDTAPGGYGEIVGEYGLVVAFEKAHSYISGFSTSS